MIFPLVGFLAMIRECGLSINQQANVSFFKCWNGIYLPARPLRPATNVSLFNWLEWNLSAGYQSLVFGTAKHHSKTSHWRPSYGIWRVLQVYKKSRNIFNDKLFTRIDESSLRVCGGKLNSSNGKNIFRINIADATICVLKRFHRRQRG
jgi:hypothetical protein